MGYAQLIQRQSSRRSAAFTSRRCDLAEAERMAGIVCKVGRITKYETTAYVGSTRIFDLDRAAGEPSSPSTVIPGANGNQESEFEDRTGEFTVMPSRQITARSQRLTDAFERSRTEQA